MNLSSVSHNNLKRIIEGYPYQETDLSDDYIFKMELAYSTFIVPTFQVDERRAISLLENRFIPLFTDIAEYEKCYGDNGNLTPIAYDFDYILSANADMIINPESEGVFIDADLFRNKAETPFFKYGSKYVGYNCDELELVARNIRNEELCRFIENPSSIYEFESFFRLLKKSILFTLAYPNSTEDTVDLTGGVSPIMLNENKFIELFTGIDQIERSPNSYVQVINLAEFFEMVLRFDFEGIILNPDTDNVRIEREMILLNFEDFRKNYDSSKYMQSHNYAFRLESLREKQ